MLDSTRLNVHVALENAVDYFQLVQCHREQVRVTAKKRDDLQDAIAAMKEHDFGIPLQFTNFRD